MLSELSKKDNLWREIAYNICKDKNLADELVQEMYLRIHKYSPKKPIDHRYIAVTLRNMFLYHCKKKKDISLEQFHYLECREIRFEPNDQELRVLEKFNELPWYQQELLDLSFDNSLRQIQSEYGINYAFVHRTVKDAKKQLKLTINGHKDQEENNQAKTSRRTG